MNSKKDSIGHVFCDHLNTYLMKRFGYKSLPAYCCPLGVTVDARKKKFDLYFRVYDIEDSERFWNKKAVVISRVGFQSVRQGHGASLLNFLIDFSKEHGIEMIGIEMASTPSILGFAEKYGFCQIGETKNYIASVKDLGEKIEKRCLLDMES